MVQIERAQGAAGTPIIGAAAPLRIPAAVSAVMMKMKKKGMVLAAAGCGQEEAAVVFE